MSVRGGSQSESRCLSYEYIVVSFVIALSTRFCHGSGSFTESQGLLFLHRGFQSLLLPVASPSGGHAGLYSVVDWVLEGEGIPEQIGSPCRQMMCVVVSVVLFCLLSIVLSVPSLRGGV